MHFSAQRKPADERRRGAPFCPGKYSWRLCSEKEALPVLDFVKASLETLPIAPRFWIYRAGTLGHHCIPNKLDSRQSRARPSSSLSLSVTHSQTLQKETGAQSSTRAMASEERTLTLRIPSRVGHHASDGEGNSATPCSPWRSTHRKYKIKLIPLASLL